MAASAFNIVKFFQLVHLSLFNRVDDSRQITLGKESYDGSSYTYTFVSFLFCLMLPLFLSLILSASIQTFCMRF